MRSKAIALVMGSLMIGWAAAVTCVAADRPQAVKVFVLAGQSNMEGKAAVKLMNL